MAGMTREQHEEALNRMVTMKRATAIAASLFPDEVADGSDCRAAEGLEGEPCQHCAYRNAQWQARITQVREAVKGAFA